MATSANPLLLDGKLGQAATIEFLASPSAYGRQGPVERIDTHAATVFLVGERAYKLKRAVTYPYLDYGTVELRRRACEAELMLNRRTAPDLYLEVRAVTRGADGSLSLTAEGDPADWLVVMRRFDQQCLFDQLAVSGGLSVQLLTTLADRIARFHAAADVTPGFGGAAAIRRVIDGNCASMTAVADILPTQDAETLHSLSIAALERLRHLLDRRCEGGHVRHCHGDLHLRNICLLEGVPTLFDCVEFSDEIACVDVLYDLSFLLMDLWHRNLKGEANLIFNRYLDITEEGDGITALPLFLSLRAAIRAHVEATASATQHEAAARQAKAELAAVYLALAADLLRPVAPRLIAIGGLSGTGKSTLARGIAPAIGSCPGARILRSDIIRKRLGRVDPETRLPKTAYTEAASAAVYAALLEGAGSTLQAGQAVAADAVFADPEERTAIGQVAARAGCRFDGLWLDSPYEVMAVRLQERTGDASDATPEVMRAQVGRNLGLIDWTRLEAGGNPDDTLAAAEAALDLDADTNTSAPVGHPKPPAP